MGDAPDTGVVILFVPLLFTPLYAAPKLLLARLGMWGAQRPVWKKLVTVAAAESCLPLVTVIASTPFFLTVRFIAPSLMNERSFRMGSYLALLFLANALANLLLEVRRTTPHIARALLSGAIATGLFAGAWVLLGHHLMHPAG